MKNKILFLIIVLFGLCACNTSYSQNPIYEYNKLVDSNVNISYSSYSRNQCEIGIHYNSYTSKRQSNYIDLYINHDYGENINGFSSFKLYFGLFSPNNSIDENTSYPIDLNVANLDAYSVNKTFFFSPYNIIEDECAVQYKIDANLYHVLIVLDTDAFDYEYGVISFGYLESSNTNKLQMDFNTYNIYFAKTDNGFLYNNNSLKELKKEVIDFNKKYNGYLKYLAENNN